MKISNFNYKDLSKKELEELNGGYYYIWGERFTDDGQPAPTTDWILSQIGGAFVTSFGGPKY